MNKDGLLEVIMKCNRCGVCQEVCPTYKVSGNETKVARGRNRLIRLALEEQLDLDNEPEIEEFINECLLCKSCEVNCPSSVPTPQIITDIRRYYTGTKGLPLMKKIMYRGIFSHNQRISLVRRFTRVYQKSGIKWLVKQSGIFKGTDELVPEMPRKSVREQLKTILKSVKKPTGKVAYFLGCSINNFFSNIGISTIKVLQENNIELIVPEVNCCGAPHKSAGDEEEFIRLAKNNLAKLSNLNVEKIIVDCATCGSILKEYTDVFKNDDKYKMLAAEIAGKIQDVSSFLIETGYKKPKGQIAAKVTYHDPCHAIRYLKIQDAPRKILEDIPGVELAEMKEADMCCGGAGSYGIFFPKTSRNILARKIKNFQETKATILATSCPACTMQLSFGMKLYDIQGKVKHPVELLWEAYSKFSKD